jgi:hypothetical protein
MSCPCFKAWFGLQGLLRDLSKNLPASQVTQQPHTIQQEEVSFFCLVSVIFMLFLVSFTVHQLSCLACVNGSLTISLCQLACIVGSGLH